MKTNIFVDPSVAGPDVRFSTGMVVDGAQTWNADLPDVAGVADPGWNITQWNTPSEQIFDPDAVQAGLEQDALLGAAIASWHTGTANSGSSLVMYGSAGNYTYQLGAAGGSTRDTFLQTTGYAAATTTFDHSIVFTADEKVASAVAGDGTAIAFNAFTVFFNAVGNPSYDPSLPSTEIFLQVPLTDFRGEPAPYETIAKGDTYQQIYNLSSEHETSSGALGSDDSVDYLAFATDAGPLHTVRIDLNQAMLRLVDELAAQDPAMASSFLDLSRWSLGSYYGGVETSAGSDTEALTLDIAHPVVTEDDTDTVTSALALSAVQSIDGGSYTDTESSDTVTTLSGTTNSIALAGGDLMPKTVTSNGTDAVLIGNGETVALHALGGRLTVTGATTSFASITIDGTAAVTTSGALGTLAIASDADGDVIGGSVNGTASLSLGGDGDQISLFGVADAALSGQNIGFAAGGGTVSMFGTGGTIDLNGTGTQTVFLNGQSARLTETGTGSQTVVGTAARSGLLQLEGGHGAQTLWTGGTSAIVTASDDGSAQASLTLRVQAGSITTVQLARETTLVDSEGGSVTVNGGTDASASATVFDGSGPVTVWGGAEQLVASVGDNGDLQVQAGSGSQTIFGGKGSLVVMGNHDTGGRQTIVNGTDPNAATTVFGGRTAQTIWSGQAHDTIVSSTAAADSDGSIQAVIQGGVSSYWGGTESATLDNLGGMLDAFLNGDGRVSIQAEMTGTGTTTLHGFSSLADTLTLGGVSDLSQLQISTFGGNTTVALNSGGGVVTLLGVSHVDLSATSGGVLVTG